MQPNNELTQFDALKAEVLMFVDPIKVMDVNDQDGADRAHAALKQVHTLAKQIEAKRTNLVKPHNEFVKRVNTYAKDISKPLEEAETHLKRGLVTWERILEQRRAEELKKIEEERRVAEEAEKRRLEAQKELDDLEALFKTETEVKQAEIIQKVELERKQTELAIVQKEKVESIESMKVAGATRRWTFEITSADEVPLEFWVIDEKKIREAVKNGAREIPGVRIYQDLSIAVR